MQPSEYISSVKEQLRAYDFEERESSSEWEHPFYFRESKFGRQIEVIVIKELEDPTVEKVKESISLATEILTKITPEHKIERWYILLVASTVTKAMEITAKRATKNKGKPFTVPPTILPVIADLENGCLRYRNPTPIEIATMPMVNIRSSNNAKRYFGI